MEELTSGIDAALVLMLKALARRGAVLRRAQSGEGSVEQCRQEAGRPAPQPLPISRSEIVGAIGKGWLKEQAANEFVLSKRGAGVLRALLSSPTPSSTSAQCGAVGSEARQSAHGRVESERGTGTPPVRKQSRPARPRLSAHESPLTWLRKHGGRAGNGMISESEFEAGERFRADFELAHMMPRVTASWDLATPAMRQRRSGPPSGLQIGEAATAARQRVEAALAAVGPRMSGVLIDVCCFLTGIEQAERNGGWPRRAGKVVLQLALEQLALHYGIGGRKGPAPGRVLHWGAEGYKPAIDGGTELDKAG